MSPRWGSKSLCDISWGSRPKLQYFGPSGLRAPRPDQRAGDRSPPPSPRSPQQPDAPRAILQRPAAHHPTHDRCPALSPATRTSRPRPAARCPTPSHSRRADQQRRRLAPPPRTIPVTKRRVSLASACFAGCGIGRCARQCLLLRYRAALPGGSDQFELMGETGRVEEIVKLGQPGW